MIYLIKFFFILLLSNYSFANESVSNQIIFKINNKVFTNIDLAERKEYVGSINKIILSEFSDSENNDILDDYISTLIFYEYYDQNKLFFKDLNNQIELIYKEKFQNTDELDLIKIKNFKYNIKIDLIRNKIIGEKLNEQKNSLLEEVSQNDLIYNYNIEYIIIKENLVDNKLITNIDNKEKFNKLKKLLINNKIHFFNKEEDINNYTSVSKKIKNIINKNIQIYSYRENGYINLISINKNLESYEGIYVKLINFKSLKKFELNDLRCNELNKNIDIQKTFFKEYEYSKLNETIKNNLKSINDYIVFNENNEYNYIILCDLTFDENLLKNINFNKNVNSIANKIQRNFLKKYKDEYRFVKVK